MWTYTTRSSTGQVTHLAYYRLPVTWHNTISLLVLIVLFSTFLFAILCSLQHKQNVPFSLKVKIIEIHWIGINRWLYLLHWLHLFSNICFWRQYFVWWNCSACSRLYHTLLSKCRWKLGSFPRTCHSCCIITHTSSLSNTHWELSRRNAQQLGDW